MSKLRNALLVYPEFPKNTYWSFNYALPMVNKRSSMPPLSLVTIAALFPSSCRLKLVDLNIEPLKKEDVTWADVVFISSMIVQKDSFNEIVKLCNNLNTPVAAGGPYPMTNCEDILGVDHFILGEVEETFSGFLTDFQKGTAKHIYPAPSRPHLKNTVTPRFDLLDLSAYGCMSVQYSRGCPFNCEFCDIWIIYGNRCRVKPTEKVIAEMDSLYRIGWRGPVFMVDDNFIGNKRKVKQELLPALIDWQQSHGYPFNFFTEASINLADDDELIQSMQQAGFNEVFIGIETPSMESLKETGKTQNMKTDMSLAIDKIQRNGMEVMAGFILGFDSDAENIFDRQIEFIQQNAIPKAMVGLLNALPGTKLYERLEREGRILGTSTGNNTHCMETNFVTRMDSEKLKEGYKKVLGSIYDSNLRNYFARCNKLLDNIENATHFRRKVCFSDLRILFRSFRIQTFTPYGSQYLKFLIRNAIKNTGKFSEAVRMTIQGHHFHTITQEMLKIEKVDSLLDESYNFFRERISRYSGQLKNNSIGAVRSVSQLWDEKVKTMNDLKKKIDRIHEDFRGDILAKYADVSEKLKTLLESYENHSDMISH
jgi:radical SAM superfamily enzyme YgiQ (UPF0313 family)